MTAEQLTRFGTDLRAALQSFDWRCAGELSQEFAGKLLTEPGGVEDTAAAEILRDLRRKRQFPAMITVAEAFIRSGVRTPKIRRQYAQALIDLGHLSAAELLLLSIPQDSQATREDEMEARGLVGRIYKQIYVAASARNAGVAARPHLERAVHEYLYTYRLDPAENVWHGINVVALLARARRDGIWLTGLPDPAAIAMDIRNALTAKPNKNEFELGTVLEATVALSSAGVQAGSDQVETAALAYAAAADADAFEFASTLRQFCEVWQLQDDTPPGSKVLPILRAALLRSEGGQIRIEPQEARRDLEKVFGADRFQSVSWYQQGLERCRSIGRVEKRGGIGYGTAWLALGSDFFPGRSGLVLLTNAHVINPRPFPRALLPSQAQVRFQMLDTVIEIEDDDVLWSSPVRELDVTILNVRTEPGSATPLPVHPRPIAMSDPPPRLYAIGHPGGGDLAFSLQDNYLLACRDPLLHYRTPTEGGSSGSPVFEADEWKVVALHHAGDSRMERLDEPGKTYEANEGISIAAIQKASQAAGPAH